MKTIPEILIQKKEIIQSWINTVIEKHREKIHSAIGWTTNLLLPLIHHYIPKPSHSIEYMIDYRKNNIWAYKYAIVKWSIELSLPLTQYYIPQAPYSIEYVLDLLKDTKEQWIWEASELTPIIGRYIRMENVVRGYNTVSKNKLTKTIRAIKWTLSGIWISSHILSGIILIHILHPYLDQSNVEKMIEYLIYLTVAWNSLHLGEKVYVISDLLKEAESK